MRETVDSDTYQRQLEDSEFPETANLYLCRAMIEAAWMDHASGGWLALSAAWACDDAGNVDGARRCRERALEFWARGEEAGEEMIENGPGASQLLQADLERRVGRFERARERCHRGLSGRPSEPVRSLLEFELELITAGDTDVHSVADVRFRRPR